MLYYDLAYFADKLGQSEKAAAFRKTARGLSPDYVFPFQSEAIEVLEAAMTADPNDCAHLITWATCSTTGSPNEP